MRARRIIAGGAGILLAILLGPASTLAAEFSWTGWKDNLPFTLTGEIEFGGQIVKE